MTRCPKDAIGTPDYPALPCTRPRRVVPPSRPEGSNSIRMGRCGASTGVGWPDVRGMRMRASSRWRATGLLLRYTPGKTPKPKPKPRRSLMMTNTCTNQPLVRLLKIKIKIKTKVACGGGVRVGGASRSSSAPRDCQPAPPTLKARTHSVSVSPRMKKSPSASPLPSC
ncbi:hypothetical protein B0H12DRAFT_218739 [Mycena haematopus]|nr:hypothetical protein B0H12DRAFT_218739 [Mycena haematopus]